MLLLVLDDHAEGEAALKQRAALEAGLLEDVEHPPTDVLDVAPGLPRVEQGQAGPFAARVLERVVQLVDRGVEDRLAAADVTQQPELLLVAHVREVPDQRRHQRRVLGDQVALVDRVGEHPGTPTGSFEIAGDALLECLVADVVGEVRAQHACDSRTSTSWSCWSAGQRPRLVRPSR